SLTAVNSFLVVFSLPAIVNLGLLAFLGDTKSLDLPFWKTLLEILQITVIPCVAGIFIRRYLPQLAKSLEKPLEYIMPVLLGITLAATVYFKESDPHINYLEHIFLLPYALSLNLLGMIIGYYSPKLLKISRRNRLTMSLEVGLQNTGLAITVATSANLLNDAEMAIPAVVYALFTFFTATGWGVWINRSRKEKSAKKVSTNKEVASNS
ncbi:MAG: bile acid:sodium symporter, partial [Bacteroidota bacterium]